MSVTPLTDLGDPRLADYTGLTDVALRRRREPAEGLFIAESEKVVIRALDAGHGFRSLLVTDRVLPQLGELVTQAQQQGAPVFVGDLDVLRELTGFQVHRGVLASMHRLPLPSVAQVLAGASRAAVLEDIVDHTNVGAIFRCAAGLGVDALLVSERCADPLYRRSVRVSMGTVFSVPYARMTDRRADLAAVRDAGLALLALTPDQTATPLRDLPPSVTSRCALLLGTEGDGLSSGWLDEADHRVRIPMAHGVDSLNVAAAAAVAFYALGPG